MSPDQIAATCASGVVVLGGIVGYWRWVRPRIQRAKQTTTAIVETLVGRDAITDAATGKELAPAQPGLGVRLAKVEQGFAELAKQSSRMDTIERLQLQQGEQINLHGTDIAALKAAALERIATKAESAQMWRAVADGDLDDKEDR